MPLPRPRLAAALLPLLLGSTALAQPAPRDGAPARQEVEEVIVTGTIAFRNRTPEPNPVLSYDLDYFQRFEPVSVGEMLKRVPGVTFASDVLEYDGVQMRGLPSGYTQVLVNGRRPPGGEADGSFFVDRIPAELVERVEIVRAPRADQPSEGIGGTLNVITKDSARFEGGFAKAGALVNEDGKVRGSAAIAFADTLASGDTSYWVALNYQGRRNPKEKVTDFFDGDFEEFTGRELQDDTRDGEDISANAELVTALGAGSIRFTGLVVDTDRDEDETSRTFEGDSPAELELDEVEIQRERIGQRTYALGSEAEVPVGPGTLGLALGWSAYREDTTAETDEGDDIPEAELVERETLDIEDDEFTGTVSYAFGPDGLRAKLGADFLSKKRDTANRIFEIDGTDVEEETPPGAISTIEETRISPYARFTLDLSDTLLLDAGLRYEVTDRDVEADGVSQGYDQRDLNPSAHLRFNPTAQDHLYLSVARTVRRPDFDLLAPYRQEEEPADEDELLGNPGLKNEKAWGIDVGYERQIGRRGIFGVNFFYRDVKDVIELVDTGAAADAGGSVYQPRNIGDGETWGAEVDLSVPLDFLGLEDTGVFANYTWLDSSVADPFTGRERRFDNQPRHLYNVGFIQTVPSWDASFGASLSGRGKARSSALDEVVDLRYGQDLEAFVEKRLDNRFVLRLTAANLLDRKKKEDFRFFDGDSVEEILEARRDNDVDEAEREREKSGVLFQVTLRATF